LPKKRGGWTAAQGGGRNHQQGIIDRIVRRAKVDPDDIAAITLAGNTTMTQLLLKVNPRYIRRSPTCRRRPSTRPSGRWTSAWRGRSRHRPGLSGRVQLRGRGYRGRRHGIGDVPGRTLTLFMDIGTNAEIVIGNRDWLACAACSAGPAFEGGGIKFGMRAAKGAIEDFSLDPVTWEPMLMTIGNVRPKGICGSGLIIMTAVMFELGLINNLGKFNRDLDTNRIREDNGVWEYVLAWADETQIDRDIVLTEIDIENLIRAKGAIYSGCMTLLEEVGMGMQDIDRIILAGGFGSYVDLEKAMTIGLLPEIDPDKVTFIGNSSLMGAKMSSLTNRIRKMWSR
jgi:uncharacterized 2Fe-2S/4Fe-4S cluster protein (DUF4445 family)